jgi:hypothetical protein
MQVIAAQLEGLKPCPCFVVLKRSLLTYAPVPQNLLWNGNACSRSVSKCTVLGKVHFPVYSKYRPKKRPQCLIPQQGPMAFTM